MTNPEKTALSFQDEQALEAWFHVNHATADELWVRVHKKATGHRSVNWDDCVRVCLAWGWIDGLKRSGVGDIWFQRLTPRRARSNWSARNMDIATRLITDGKMQPSGIKQVSLALQDGRWKGPVPVALEMSVVDLSHRPRNCRAWQLKPQ